MWCAGFVVASDIELGLLVEGADEFNAHWVDSELDERAVEALV